MSKTSEYMCHEKIVALLERSNLSLAALRLTHACYHFIDQHPGWRLENMNLTGERCCTARSTEILAFPATPGATDNDMIMDGIRDLEGTAIFDVLKRSANGRKLMFRFSRRFVKCGTRHKGDLFSMVDLDWIARLRSRSHILFYTRAVMAERSRCPQFYLPGIDPLEAPWSKSKRGWQRAAERVGQHLGHDYLFIPELDEFREDIVRVRVKITTPRTEWSEGKLYPRRSAEPASVVEAGKARALTAAELASRSAWREVATVA